MVLSHSMMKRTTKQAATYIDAALYERLKNKASDDHRSVSNVLDMLIRQYVNGKHTNGTNKK